jgi:hypothetical protein
VSIETLLGIIAVLLFLVVWKLGNIDSRLKDRFPTDKERDHRWAMEDPHGHWDAHKDDESLKRKK